MANYNYKVKAVKVFNLKYPWVMVERKTNHIVDNADGEGYRTIGLAWKNWKRQHKLGIAPKIGKTKVKQFRRRTKKRHYNSPLANKVNEYKPVISPEEKKMLEQRLKRKQLKEV